MATDPLRRTGRITRLIEALLRTPGNGPLIFIVNSRHLAGGCDDE